MVNVLKYQMGNKTVYLYIGKIGLDGENNKIMYDVVWKENADHGFCFAYKIDVLDGVFHTSELKFLNEVKIETLENSSKEINRKIKYFRVYDILC